METIGRADLGVLWSAKSLGGFSLDHGHRIAADSALALVVVNCLID